MSYRQFGERMGMTASSAAELAMREEEGTITLNVLRKAADALNMELVHIFIQKSTASNSAERTLDGLIDEQARKVVTGIVI